MAIAKKKKKFWNVEIPCINKETQLYALDLEDLEGRIITYDLTRLLKGKSAMLQAIVEVQGDEAVALARQIILLPYYTKRMVRKGTNYVEDSFSTEAKDSIIKIKPFLVTRRKVSRAVRKALRNKAKEELIAYAKENNSQDIVIDILRNNIQRTLSLALKKIYPLSSCEIRMFKVEKVLKKVEAKKEPKEKEAHTQDTSQEEITENHSKKKSATKKSSDKDSENKKEAESETIISEESEEKTE